MGLREDWAQGNPELVSALVRAAEWADQPRNNRHLLDGIPKADEF